MTGLRVSDVISMMHNSRQMTIATLPKRLGFFTRLLDQVDPAERYRLATAQIRSGWPKTPRSSI